MKIRIGRYQTWWSTYLAVVAIGIAVSGLHEGIAFLFSMIALFGGFALRNRPYSNVLRTMVLLTFVTVATGYFVNAVGGNLSQSVYFSTLGVAITALLVSMPKHLHEPVSTRIRIPGFAFASVPLMVSLPIAATHSARWTHWLSWGGDFGIHRHLIGSLASNNHFTIGEGGTPVTWHYLVYIVLGKSVPTMSEFAIAVITTFTILAVVGIIVATPRGSGGVKFLVAAGVSMLFSSTLVIQFVVSGFVTTTASAAFALATMYFAMPRKGAEFTPISMAYAAMSAAVSVCLWQPMIILVTVICIAMLPRIFIHYQEVVKSWSSLLGVFLAAILTANMLYLTHQANAFGGGAAPVFSTQLAISLALLLFILSFQLSGRDLKVFNLLVSGVGSLILLGTWWRAGWGDLDYFPRKTAWAFLLVCLVLLVRVIAKSFEEEPRLGWRALAALIATILLVGGHIDWATSRLWLKDTIKPTTNEAAIFSAIDEIEKTNAAGAFFIRSGNDYIANLWVMFGLSLPSGPVDPSLQTQPDQKSMCDFTYAYPTSPIYTREPSDIRQLLSGCKGIPTNPVRDLRAYASDH